MKKKLFVVYVVLSFLLQAGVMFVDDANAASILTEDFEDISDWTQGGGTDVVLSTSIYYAGSSSAYINSNAGGTCYIYRTLSSSIADTATTVSFWVYISNTTSAIRYLVGIMDALSPADQFYVGVNASLEPFIYKKDEGATGVYAYSSVSLTTGVWYKLTLVADAGTVHLYNGTTEIASMTYSSGDTFAYCKVGDPSTAGAGWYYIDDLTVSNTTDYPSSVNNPPEISNMQPADNTTINGTTVTLSADIQDPDGDTVNTTLAITLNGYIPFDNVPGKTLYLPVKAYNYNRHSYFVYNVQNSTGVYKPIIIRYNISIHKFDQYYPDIGTVNVSNAHGAPSITIDPSGYIYVVWGDGYYDNTYIYYVKSTSPDNLSNFTSPAPLATSAYSAYPLILVLDNGDLIFVYRDGSDGQYWKIRKSTDGGTSWITASTILDFGTYRPYVFMFTDGTNIYWGISYHDGTSDHQRNLYLIYSDDEGTTWYEMGSSTALTLPISYTDLTPIITSDATEVYGGQVYNGNPYLICESAGYYKLAYWDGSSWQVKTIVADGSGTTAFKGQGASLYVDATGIYTYLPIYENNHYNIKEYKSTDGGATWTKTADITSSNSSDYCYPFVPVNSEPDTRVYFMEDDGGTYAGDPRTWEDDNMPRMYDANIKKYANIGNHFYLGRKDIVSSGNITATVSNLTRGTQYSWKIWAFDGTNLTVSDDFTFSITAPSNHAPYAISYSPSDGTTGLGTTVQLQVEVRDDDGDNVTVDFKEWNSTFFIGSDTVNNATATATWSNLSYNTTYTWYAVLNDGQNSTTIGPYSFTTRVNYAPQITEMTPANGSVNVSLSPDLTIHIYDNDSSSVTVCWWNYNTSELLHTANAYPDEYGNTSIGFIWSNLNETTTYYWYVTVDDGYNNVTSDVYHFTTREFTNISEAVWEDVDYYFDPASVNWTSGESNFGQVISFTNEADETITRLDFVYNDSMYDDTSTVQLWIYQGGLYTKVATLHEGDSCNVVPDEIIGLDPGDSFSYYLYVYTPANVSNGSYTGHAYWNIQNGTNSQLLVLHQNVTNEGSGIINRTPHVYCISPADYATNINVSTVNLTINISDPDGDNMTAWVVIGTDVPTTSYLIGSNLTNGTYTYTLHNLSYGTTYLWYGKVTDGKETNLTAYNRFTTEPAPSNTPPVIISRFPHDNESIQLDRHGYAYLSATVWDADGGYITAGFYVRKLGESTWSLYSEREVVSGSLVTLKFLLEGNTTYQWFVHLVDDNNAYYDSEIWNFTTEPYRSNPPTMFQWSPYNGANDVSFPITIHTFVYDEDSSTVAVYIYINDALVYQTNVSFDETREPQEVTYSYYEFTPDTDYTYYIYLVDDSGASARFPTVGSWTFHTVYTAPPSFIFYLRNASNPSEYIYDATIECVEKNYTVHSDLFGVATMSFDYSDIGKTYHFIITADGYRKVETKYTVETGTTTKYIKMAIVQSSNNDVNNTQDALSLMNQQLSPEVKIIIAFIIIGLITGAIMWAGGLLPATLVAILGTIGFTIAGWLPWWIIFLVLIAVAVPFAGSAAKIFTGGGDKE